jgi:hypothetical protein
MTAMLAWGDGGLPGAMLRCLRRAASAGCAVVSLLALLGAQPAWSEVVQPPSPNNPGPTAHPAPTAPSPTIPAAAPPAVQLPVAAPSATPAAAPAATPAAVPVAPPAAAALPVANLRTGNHPAFGRIVVDLPPGATVATTTEGVAVHVRLAGAAFGGSVRAPHNVTAISVQGSDATLTLAAGAHISTRRFGARFIIDVFADGAAPAEPGATEPAAAAPSPPAAPAASAASAAPAIPAAPAPKRLPGFSGPPPRSGPLPSVPLPAGAQVADNPAAAPVSAMPAPSGSAAAAASASMHTMPASPSPSPSPSNTAPAPVAAQDVPVRSDQAATQATAEHVRVPLQRLLEGNLPSVLRAQPATPPPAAPPPAVRQPGVVAARTATSPATAATPRMAIANVPPQAAPPALPAAAPPASAASAPAPMAAAAPAATRPASPAPPPTQMPMPMKTSAGVSTAPVADVQRTTLASPAETPAPPVTMSAGTMSAGTMSAAPPASPAGQGPMSISARSDGPTLILPFLPTTGAAAFRRGTMAVVVFDEPRPIDLSNLSEDSQVAGAFSDARIQLLPNATVLRMTLPAEAGLRLARREEGWSLTRLAQPPPLAPIRSDVIDGSMRLVANAPRTVISVPDPDTGGALLVGTQTERGQGVPVTRRTPGFTLLETLQGVAVDPNSDSLTLRVAPAKDFTGFIITAEGEAAMLPPPKPEPKAGAGGEAKPETKAEEKPAGDKAAAKDEKGEKGDEKSAEEGKPKTEAKAEPPPLTETGRGVPLDPLGPEAVAALEAARMTRRWDLPALPTDSLRRRLQAITAGAAAAPPQSRTAGRLAAVQAQIALGLGAEADALTNLIVTEDARATDMPDVIGLNAVAAMLAGRLDEAAGIDDPRLDGTDEVNFWRAVRKAMLREGAPDAAAAFAATIPLLQSYPMALRERLEPLAAETMLAGGEPEAARRLMQTHKDFPPLDYARALLAERDGRLPAALAIYDRLTGSHDRLARARAAVRAVELRLRTGAFSNAQAADALDKLVYSWRGDRRELAIRLRVAELRDASNNWRASLALLRETAENAQALGWPDELPDLRTRMAGVFQHALDSDAKSALPPLELVALIQENPDLIPDGAAGRAIAARLADRLVALELPDRALPILDKLMRATAEGQARSEIGARLAGVRLDLQDPAAALEALSASTAGDLPPDLTEARTIIFARATAARGGLAAATAALAALDTEAADEARATLLEQAKDWPGAVSALSAYAQKTVPAGGMLAEKPANVLLRLASAAAQAGDEKLLARLRERELSRMPAGKLADMFRLLTERPVQGVADLPRAAQEAAFDRTVPAELDTPRKVATKP